MERQKLKILHKLYIFIEKNLHSIWIFLANNLLLIVDLGIFASNIFVFVFFYETREIWWHTPYICIYTYMYIYIYRYIDTCARRMVRKTSPSATRSTSTAGSTAGSNMARRHVCEYVCMPQVFFALLWVQTEPIRKVRALQVHRYVESVLLIVQYRYLKSFSWDFYSPESDPPHKIMRYWFCSSIWLGFSFPTHRICQVEMICIGGVPVSKRHLGGAGP